MKAIWDVDYDMWAEDSDGAFMRPMCPNCHEPIGKIGEDGDENYRCYNCYEVVEVDDKEMLKWFDDRAGTKTDMTFCLACGGEDCVESHYYKDPRTLKWKMAGGVCKNCGARFIV